jgi:hypothetical protein
MARQFLFPRHSTATESSQSSMEQKLANGESKSQHLHLYIHVYAAVDGEHMEINRVNFWSVACKRLRPRTETFELNIQQLRYEWDVIN